MYPPLHTLVSRRSFLCSASSLLLSQLAHADSPEARKPKDDHELRYWLENMVWYHRFTPEEVSQATGLSVPEVKNALKKFHLSPATKPKRRADVPLLVLPYPGGRHPRIGFLDGAVDPQRETKVSVFTPWDESSYVVVDVPEAIWSHLGLLYLAHTHVPTLWTTQKINLERLEWQRKKDGALEIERKLPNQVRFGTKIRPLTSGVSMELWLTNGTKQTLKDLRVQNCVLLKGAAGFTQLTNDNKLFLGDYAACRSPDGQRWIITGWSPIHRTWGNQKCPCLHADPRFPDCAPGETKHLRGWVSFFQGKDIHAEFRRLDTLGWRKKLLDH